MSIDEPHTKAGAPLPAVPHLEASELMILRLVADGRSNREILVALGGIATGSALKHQIHGLREKTGAETRVHLGSLGATYRLVTKDHLTDFPTITPSIRDTDRRILSLSVTGQSAPYIASQVHRSIHTVADAFGRLRQNFGVRNRQQLATFAVLLDTVTCNYVDPRFPEKALSAIPVTNSTPRPEGSAARQPRASCSLLGLELDAAWPLS